MLYKDWLAWALKNEDLNLHYFNVKNEISFHNGRDVGQDELLHEDLWPPHIKEFADFLQGAGLAEIDAVTTFARRCTRASRAGASLLRRRPLVGVKSYGSGRHRLEPTELGALGLSSDDCDNAITKVESVISDAMVSLPLDLNFTEDEKKNIGAIVREGFISSPRTLYAARAHSATETQNAPDIIAPTAANSKVNPDFIWVACRKALDVAAPPPTDRADALLSSAHITQVRRELGLHGGYDLDPDRHPDIDVTMTRLLYRTLVEFEVEFSEEDIGQVRQPNVFSGGFDYLFVSRRPAAGAAGDDDMPGHTVRLFDRLCDHDGGDVADCPRCGGMGLPEAVVPRGHVFSRGRLILRGAHVAYAADLGRYDAPDTSMIRLKNHP